MLTVSGLRKVFGSALRATAALDDVELTVPAGAFASVLGPSGSGKTTLLRCIAGFERPDAGVITLAGRELVSPTQNLRPYARAVGIVPQEGALFPHLTVADNVGFGLSGQSRRARRARVAQLLDLVGLPELGERRPDQLSGGQQQRVALARALAPEPKLVLLDEPFSALDAQLRIELREEVRDLIRSTGSTTLLVTHDQAEAMSLSDHLIVMREGRVIAAGDPHTVYDRPVDAQLGRFLGEALILPGQISRGSDGVYATCALGRLKVSEWAGDQSPCDVLVRPEQIDLRATNGAAPPAAVVGTIRSTLYFGHDALMRVTVPGISQQVPVRVPGLQTYRVGDHAELEVTDTVRAFPRGVSQQASS
ncbi:ABC transporter ATP-binding protein [Mycobacterium sp. 21AC1]|uniref:ABC transporter ATP-binding protein n=1 Tax=[Mycobacterium] appelbergii TaxID=2939269 RepID=UPI0029391BA4|nr:ABC transporter ATP-binding protein [Mycobacterium sp. 21AC1]MDV3130388.1 ABC transporter ATP-binding protein [Mycobacterium sp. 21AC1]